MTREKRSAGAPTPVPERQSGEHARTSGVHAEVYVPPAEPGELDIDLEQQARITDFFLHLGGLDFYALLGVAHDADTKTIKRAYNARVIEFHPDRYFRKRLGTFKPKLEAIFARMTEAQEVLCSAIRRAEYDAALRTTRHSLIDAMLEEALVELKDDEPNQRYEILHPHRVEVVSSPPPPGRKPIVRPKK
jgi:hypothetical protein